VNAHHVDHLFAGSIPQVYERYLVPLIFESYAADLATRIGWHKPVRVLEIAAGTGVVTRRLAASLAPEVSIVATDLNQPMLAVAAATGTARPVDWRQADAQQLPFPDCSFDAVVCQFGVMFFPDKARAYAEARRVLRPRGVLVFNTWDRIDRNDFAAAVTRSLQGVFPADPPLFLARVPYGYDDLPVIAHDLRAGGFTKTVEMSTLPARSRAASPRQPAIAFCQGTPLRNEIEARAPARLAEITGVAAAAIARDFGDDAVDGGLQAHVITVER
jgi:SAM-dependent methyltransferase